MNRSASRIPRLRTRGRANRARLLREAERLLGGPGKDTVRFSDVFKAAGVSRGSAYRIYIGMDDLLQDLAGEWLHNFIAFLEEDEGPSNPQTWMELSDYIVERAGRYWTETADALKVMAHIRSLTQASYEAAVADLGQHIAGLFDHHFVVPEVPAWGDKIALFTQLCDLAFTDALRTVGTVEASRVAEAQALCRTLLSFYLPAELPAR